MARPMGLRLLQINVWSGSKYQGELDPSSGFSFTFYEDKARREARYQGASANTTPRGIRVALVRPTSLHHRLWNQHDTNTTTLTLATGPTPVPELVKEILELDPDVVTLNECMPCFSFAHRLAKDVGMDCCASLGVAGIVFGFLRFPFISEGDAILAKPAMQLRFAGRAQLTGGVRSSSLSFNLDDSTQALACKVGLVNLPKGVVICCTHWQASVVSNEETWATMAAMDPMLKNEAARAVERGQRREGEGGRGQCVGGWGGGRSGTCSPFAPLASRALPRLTTPYHAL